MTTAVESPMDTYDAMMEANARLMGEVYRDGKLQAAEKLKSFSIGVRNQVLLSRDLAQRRAELLRYGLKANGHIQALTFSPLDDIKAADATPNPTE